MLSRSRLQLIIPLAAAVLFIPGLGAVHLFDWDEINFAEIAREMLVSGDPWRPQMGFEPFHEKPPLFIWMQAISMSVFGIGEFAARLPNAICGIVTLLVLFRIGDRLRGPTFGALWVLAYIGSILPHLYFRSGIIDPWFNLFIFLGIDRLVSSVREDTPPNTGRGQRNAALMGLFLGLAVMTKGPVGILVPGIVLVVFWIRSRFRPLLRWRSVLSATVVFMCTIGSWAIIDLVRNGPDFMVGFFWRQVAMLTTEDAGHGGFFGYHFIVLLIGCFPASVFALQELLQPTRDEGQQQNTYRTWMVILFWVVLVLFSLVQTKIVHYSSLAYFPLTYLAAIQLERIWKKQESFGWSRFLVGIIGTLIAVIFTIVPFIGMHVALIEPLFAKDPFAQGNMEALVTWTGVEALAGVVLLMTLGSAHLLHGKDRHRQSLALLFAGTALFITTTLFFFINNIEGYTQRAAVEFFESKAHWSCWEQQVRPERCWVLTKGYKSYVPEFYGRICEAQPVEDTLCYGAIDRPVYLSCKITSVSEVEAMGTFTELYRKNGFVFYKRDP